MTTPFLGLRPHVWQGLLILVATFWIYAPAFHGGWLWDDTVLITQNPLMQDPGGLWKIWFQPGGNPDFYPLTATFQRIEWNLWGMEPFGYHLVNVALHVTSALLVWRLLARLGLRLAWLGGLLFAIHPIQVESVAWVAELKNVLSLALFLCAMCAWIDFDRDGKWGDFVLALGLFLIALLSKISVVMFPLVILLHAWWRRGRIGGRDLWRSAPFFALSLAVGLIPIWSGTWARAFGHLDPRFLPEGGAPARFVLAGTEFAFYFIKCVWPVGLMPVYPKWTIDASSPLQYLPWLIFAGFLGCSWLRRKSWGRHALLGVGIFIINLLPCPGFIPAPNMGYAWVMDHFLYLPIIGLIGLAVATLDALPELHPNLARNGVLAALASVAIVLAWGSHSYAKLYRDERTLWTYNARYNPNSWMVHLNLGLSDEEDGNFPSAIAHYRAALNLDPDYAGLHIVLANALGEAGHLDDAIAQYQLVANAVPDYHDVSFLLGNTLFAAHRIPEARECFQEIVQRNPRHAGAHAALGNILLAQNKNSEAIEQFAQAVAIDDSNAELHYALGNALLKGQRLPEACDQYQRAARLAPRDLEILGDFGVVLVRLGRIPEAAQQFQTMLDIDPHSAAAHTNMGSLFLTVGKIPEAIAQYQEALRLDPTFTEAQQDLARARAIQAFPPQPAKH